MHDSRVFKEKQKQFNVACCRILSEKKTKQICKNLKIKWCYLECANAFVLFELKQSQLARQDSATRPIWGLKFQHFETKLYLQILLNERYYNTILCTVVCV